MHFMHGEIVGYDRS